METRWSWRDISPATIRRHRGPKAAGAAARSREGVLTVVPAALADDLRGPEANDCDHADAMAVLASSSACGIGGATQ
jgi:hypothetical protein